MLNGLKLGDRSPELLALTSIGGRAFEHVLHAADDWRDHATALPFEGFFADREKAHVLRAEQVLFGHLAIVER